MEKDKGCGCAPDTSPPQQPLSTGGLDIMPSMDTACGCGPSNVPMPAKGDEQPGYKLCSYVETFIQTDAGRVPIIKSKPDKQDLFQTFYVRCGILRYQYKVAPGLYGIGSPDKDSEVLVTANFKLTFDHLRKELSGVNAWILVLDTKGINVWCAAGKGTFSTAELVFRIKESGLEKVVDHKRVILPQLGAVGVSARSVKKQSGFRVIYGPIRAADIPAFLKNGKKADKKMRMVTFSIYERFILTPVEIQICLKPALMTALVLLFISGIGPGIYSFSDAIERGGVGILAFVTGILSGALVTPVLLPWIPFRQFAAKGIITGSIFAVLLLIFMSGSITGAASYLALFLFSVMVSSYLAMNFTGTTPFTSPTGVEKEMKQFIPVQLVGMVLSCGLWIYAAF